MAANVYKVSITFYTWIRMKPEMILTNPDTPLAQLIFFVSLTLVHRFCKLAYLPYCTCLVTEHAHA